MRSREGRAAVDEALAALRAARPVGGVDHAACLSAGAQDHARDQGLNGRFSHTGSDGTSPAARVQRHGGPARCGEVISFGWTRARDVVVDFLVDDGVPGRGHRRALLNAEFSMIGAALDDHRVAGSIAVVVMCLGRPGPPNQPR